MNDLCVSNKESVAWYDFEASEVFHLQFTKWLHPLKLSKIQ